ncbi:MAG: DUF4388 domain-containing protein, partial [Deltaproteobacteria bacterium]
SDATPPPPEPVSPAGNGPEAPGATAVAPQAVAVPAAPAQTPTAVTRPTVKKRSTPKAAARDIVPLEEPEAGASPADSPLVVEEGRLGKIKVPALLKRCAALSRPVVLRVRTGETETAVHFAAGQIGRIASRLRHRDNAGQWRQLGYLMVRDGLISDAQHDQVLERLEAQPGLSFAAALTQFGFTDGETLRQALTRQGKAALYALILFTSGEYRIEADDDEIPAEEEIALQVDALIREASHHQAEWTAIRKALPNLAAVLDFTADGREKLEQVRLSVHQQQLLSQVDGRTPLGILCSRSSLMDYEACRFLYLMVKAGVLQLVAATPR